MTRRLAALVPVFASFALLAACGSSPAGGGDGGTLQDGGARQDGGSLQDGGAAQDGGAPDAGRPDGGRVDGGRPDGGSGDGGMQCLESGCVDATGAYNACLNCGVFGRFGPYDVDITQSTCQFTACVRTTPDGGPQCTDGCIDENGDITFQIRQGAITANCNGTVDSTTHTATMTCTVPGLGSCSGDMRQTARANCN